ncbi:MAG TPA: type I methionyl aminopeptidase [Candidatus Cloacimonas acidaminovorans]|nr:type I methionyl aminopeptidase [Candidatus Cloacimonas acidaminovorans]HRS61299.1 type I methionyl aminopeptidase [Candidatus Cloacimonas sp.]HOM79588.1 type I methionyl aminopeptidase [Candidatus Cloacimonas acidaminovorans]HOS07722.1 type I methionyl aminopeptidase [Candidatus Cloacimonas acidaminovorans]HOT39163.1 type I methionyl aminopeptidase [Candidatus Cloacimonas acidaminovorans]
MIYIKTPAEIEKMRKSCRIIGELLDALETIIRPGISTLEIDKFAEDFIGSRGGKPSFKGYRVDGLPPFPGSICASVNEQIVHGIPSAKKILQDGDIIGIDVGVVLDGYNGDAARTYKVGKISAEAEELLQVTKEALERGISAAIPGNRVGDISYEIGSFVAFRGYYVADNLTGHGVGRNLHEEPQIPNTGKPGRGPRLSAGMTLAIEPMVNIGTNRVLENGWEFKVADNSLSAHFEHTILVTDNKPEILTVAD